MKYLLLCLLLVSCGVSEQREIARLQRESELFCSCHGGLQSFVTESDSLDFQCNDGKLRILIGNMRSMAIRGPVCIR